MTAERTCSATRYGPTRECEGPPKFDVVYRTAPGGRELDREAVCFRHGIALIDRHVASAGQAYVDMVEAAP